jgi:hypothetical protein
MLTSFWVITANVARNIERTLLERRTYDKNLLEKHPLKESELAMGRHP